MDLLPQSIRKQLPPLGHFDGHDPATVPCPLKIFNPCGSYTAYFVEASDEGSDTILYGLSDLFGDGGELGFTSLAELRSVRGAFGIGLERDRYFATRKPFPTLDEVLRMVGQSALADLLSKSARERKAALEVESSIAYSRIALYEGGGTEPSPLVRPATDDDGLGLDCAVPA